MIILIVAAHPDDEVLGCFGTVAKMIQDGHKAYTLILGEGKTSRDNLNDSIENLKEEALKANQMIGVEKVFFKNFPDNRFDTVALLDIVQAITQIKESIKPDIIFTHFKHDLNIDHRLTYEAVLTATRPMEKESVKEIYSFEILSSTEWNYPLSFSPNTFFDITTTIDAKVNAMNCYKSELREFPHPRSLEGIRHNALTHGIKVGRKYVEAFEAIRIIR